jgi:dTDP-3-amino-3,4,6-trideoxy-alpha-D-glucose transaminase
MSIAPISLNDFERQWADTGQAVLEAVRKVGESGWYILGPEVAGFEQSLAARLGRRFAVGCASGLDAIEISLRALGLKAGDKVLTTPLSAFATTLAILRAGGRPVFVDVDQSGLVDLDRARDACAHDSSIRFFVPVHLFGHACNLEGIADFKTRFHLKVVEDCAQAIGAYSGEHPVGSVGNLSALSFYPTKNLGALGDGGAVLTDDSSLAQACRSIRDYGQTAKYVHDLRGLNSRLDELHAAILRRAFLPKLAGWLERRQRIAERYLQAIQHPSVRIVPLPPGCRPAWHLFPVMVEPGRREDLCRHLQEGGVRTGIHYPMIIPRQKALGDRTVFDVVGELTRADAFAAGEVSLPIHAYLRDDEVETIVSTINGWKL